MNTLKALILLPLSLFLLTGCSSGNMLVPDVTKITETSEIEIMAGGGEWANEVPTSRQELRYSSVIIPGEPFDYTLNVRYHSGQSTIDNMDFNRAYLGGGIRSGPLSTELTFSEDHYRWQGRFKRDRGPWQFTNTLSYEKSFPDSPKFKRTRVHSGASYLLDKWRIGCEYTTGPGGKREVTDFFLCGLSTR